MKRLFIIILLLSLSMGCQNSNEIEDGKQNDTKVEVNSVDSINEQLYDFTSIIENLSQISNMRNVSVYKDGQMILESYFNNCSEQSKNNVFSVTKSVTALLVGKAIEEGYLEGANQKVSSIINMDTYNVPEAFYDITIENLLTMSSGIAWDNSQHTNEFINLKASEDPLTYIFNKASTFTPGTRFNYSDATAHLMAEVLYYATGKLPLDYATEKLFEPLGIDSVVWSDARDGVQIGGCDLHLSLSDMQKIGQLVLNEGAYDGQQLIAADWIQTCTSSKITTGSYGGYDESYGYYYWLGQVGELETYSCLGHGGQFIIVIPEKNTVITASTIGGVSDQKAYEQFGGVSRILYQQLIPLL